MSANKRHLSKLIAKARRGEDIGIRHEDDIDAFVGLESIRYGWDHGERPSDDDIEVLMEAEGYVVLPRRGGRAPKSRKAQIVDAKIRAAARKYYKQQRKECPAEEAGQRTLTEMRKPSRYKKQLEGKSDKTLLDRWGLR